MASTHVPVQYGNSPILPHQTKHIFYVFIFYLEAQKLKTKVGVSK